MTATLWPDSKFNGECDYCGEPIDRATPRVRTDLGTYPTRTWHVECYATDGSPEGPPRDPRSAGSPGARTPRGRRPSSTASNAPSGAAAPLRNVSSGAEIVETSISVERRTDTPPGYVAGHVLIRLQTRVSGTGDSVGSEVRKLRQVADSNLRDWEDDVFPALPGKKPTIVPKERPLSEPGS